MESFKGYIKPDLESLYEGTNVAFNDFIKSVNGYSNLDDALLHLPEEYTEFYLKNINNKKLTKELEKRNLIEMVENWNTEYSPDQTTAQSPEPSKFKRIHYKGEYIILKYEDGIGWIPFLGFRSITKALKYAKELADEF